MTTPNDRFPFNWDNWPDILPDPEPDPRRDKEKAKEDLFLEWERESLLRDAQIGLPTSQYVLANHHYWGRSGF
ncbi:MAG: hypothetical protein J6S75_03970, partial [Thermoguttaceae bacterium]|nr:hypothetical protein [Thermoguttaceae bacterium]